MKAIDCEGTHGADSPANRLWDTTEAAQFLGVSVKQVQRLAAAGKVPAVRLGKLWRFSPAVLAALAEAPADDSAA